MSETTETPATETPKPESTDRRCHRGCEGRAGHRRRGGFFRRLFGAALFVGALVGVPMAVAHAAGFGPGCHGGWNHEPPKSAEELRQHMDKGAAFFYDRVDATEEQEAGVGAVLDRMAPELFALQDDKVALHDDLRAAMTADTVDAAEVESLRQEGLALADRASRIVVGGVVDVAHLLTPEQRADLAEAADRFHRR